MEFTVQRLRSVLEALAPAVPKKTSLPVTLNVRLGDGEAVVTDLEVQVRLRLPEAEGEPPLLLPHRKALEFLKAVPGNTRITLQGEDKRVLLQAGLTKLRLDTIAAEDFPPPVQAEFAGTAEVDGDALVGALEDITPYTIREESRPVLTGVCLTLGDPAEVCGADGFRLAYRPLPFAVPPLEGGPPTLIIPRETVRVLAHLWRKVGKKPANPPEGLLVQMLTARRPIRLRYGGMALGNIRESMEFAFGEVSLITRLEVGTFPNYHQLIPTDSTSQVTVQGDVLMQALRQVIPVAEGDIIRLQWGDGSLVLSARGNEVGEAEVMVWAETKGEPGRIAFKHQYLAEYLKGKERPVTIQVTRPSSPGVFTSTDPIVVVVMPMFVQWDGEPAQKEPVAEDAPAEEISTEETQEEAQPVEEEAEAPEAPEPVEQVPEPEAPPKPKSRRRGKSPDTSG